jgi:formate-dependent nitrite reductase membrane component NrfD
VWDRKEINHETIVPRIPAFNFSWGDMPFLMETDWSGFHSIDFMLMVFSIIAVFLFIFGLYVSTRSSVEAAKLIMGGEFTLSFWFLVVGLGILIPLALEVYELIPHYAEHVKPRDHNPWILGIFVASVLIGGFALRCVVIYAGQMSQAISS